MQPATRWSHNELGLFRSLVLSPVGRPNSRGDFPYITYGRYLVAPSIRRAGTAPYSRCLYHGCRGPEYEQRLMTHAPGPARTFTIAASETIRVPGSVDSAFRKRRNHFRWKLDRER